MRSFRHFTIMAASVSMFIAAPAQAEDLFLSCIGRTEHPDGRFMFALNDKYQVTGDEMRFWNKFRNIFVNTCGFYGDQCKTEVTPTFIRHTRIYGRQQMRSSIHINRLTGAYLGYSISLKPENARDPQISRSTGICEKIADPASATPRF